MTSFVQLVIAHMVEGFKDSMCGVRFLYKLHKENQNKQQEELATQSNEPMTALAKRRAERSKETNQQRESKKSSEPNVLQRILLCCAWNGGLFWLSIVIFNQILIPCLQSIVNFIIGGSSTYNVAWHWIGSLMSYLFGALWILPLFIMSKIVNAIWFQDIADAAYKKTRGRIQSMPSVGKVVADLLFSITLQTFFLIQGMIAQLLPIPALGHAVYLLHMTLLYSLYSFEYRWFNMGHAVHKRLHRIETDWPYFVGFGLPLVLLTNLPQSFVISGCVFSILFPLFIISGNEAELKSHSFDYPLRIFSPVIRITDSIFHFSVKGRASQSQSSIPGTSQSKPSTSGKDR